MLKKTITYDDYNEETRTEDFYFSFTKLEILELDVQFDGGLEGHLEKLQKTENGKEAYYLFKDIVLSAYGVKSDDGKFFTKSKELRDQFESSPAMSDMIIGFIQNPAEGAAFIEACLPAKLIAAAKEFEAKQSNQPQLPLPSAPVPDKYPTLVEDKKPEEGLTLKQMNAMSREELEEALRKANSK